MTRRTYSGREIIKALGNWGYKRVRQRGDHVILKYQDPNTGEIRTVTVPLHDELSIGTLKSIAEQAGAQDFQRFLDEMDRMV
ncbi:type II toxin-antitoxin system HicA family toxin [Natronoarchaeum philippinense]|uniref:type II toxin-antitoxin system HicA family toxin n=1 Tax=Natronoarchaeum philippinense TaxID=558529 RepID=UPI000BE26527|nr:type II toxin-antitoxin system HicA family toxin [Natronoarchaeum philippinense]